MDANVGTTRQGAVDIEGGTISRGGVDTLGGTTRHGTDIGVMNLGDVTALGDVTTFSEAQIAQARCSAIDDSIRMGMWPGAPEGVEDGLYDEYGAPKYGSPKSDKTSGRSAICCGLQATALTILCCVSLFLCGGTVMGIYFGYSPGSDPTAVDASSTAGEAGGLAIDSTAPTLAPSPAPTPKPTASPSPRPTDEPTETPTEEPTEAPTEAPTDAPTEVPTERPTTPEPTERPTEKPTERPTTPEPTERPTEKPTERPTTPEPTERPTERPTDKPTERPTEKPTHRPTEKPTPRPTTPPPTPRPTVPVTTGPWRCPTPVAVNPLKTECSHLPSCKAIFDDPNCDSSEDGLYSVEGNFNTLQVWCDMTGADGPGGGAQLAYWRDNFAFNPDHIMQLEPQPWDGAVGYNDRQSSSYWIPDDATTWRWDVRRDCNPTWQWIQSTIPAEAWTATTADSTITNVELADVSTGGGMNYGGGKLYLQKNQGFLIQPGGKWECIHGWYGIVRSKQDQKFPTDPFPNGIGGHCTDSCQDYGSSGGIPLSSSCWGGGDCLTSGLTMTRQYMSDFKDVGGGDGDGGATCNDVPNKHTLNYRIWVW